MADLIYLTQFDSIHLAEMMGTGISGSPISKKKRSKYELFDYEQNKEVGITNRFVITSWDLLVLKQWEYQQPK